MRKTVMVLAALLTVSAVAAEYAGRTVFTMTQASVTMDHSKYRDGIRLAAVDIVYAQPFTGTLSIYTVKSGVQTLRYTVSLTSASSVVFVPEELWFKKSDRIVITNSAAAQCQLVLDYVE